VRVIAGSSNGVVGAMNREITEPVYLDIEMPADSQFSTRFPATYNGFVFVYRGELIMAGTELGKNRMAILANTSQSDGVVLIASEPTRAILVAGHPLCEPIVQHGPFVMNSKEEIMQAVKDYNEGRLAV
jgi:redox-sensitive bicupin YhaK (pirin superfamily)